MLKKIIAGLVLLMPSFGIYAASVEEYQQVCQDFAHIPLELIGQERIEGTTIEGRACSYALPNGEVVYTQQEYNAAIERSYKECLKNFERVSNEEDTLGVKQLFVFYDNIAKEKARCQYGKY